MLLVIVVHLIFVESHLAIRIFVFPAGIVSPPQTFHLALCGVVPGVARALRAVEGDEFHHGSIGKIASLEEVRIKARGRAANVTVRADIGKSTAKRPMLTQHSCAEEHTLFVRTERTGRAVHL